MVLDVVKCISLDFPKVLIRSSSYIDSQTNFNIGMVNITFNKMEEAFPT